MVDGTQGATAVQARDRAVARVLWGVLALNLAVAAGKLAVGLAIGALSLTADGVHSLLDASANVVGLVGISIAARPPDSGHPYGHRRYETIAAMVIGLLIAAGLFEIGHAVVQALLDGQRPPSVSWATAGFVAVTIVVNLAISRYERGRARALRSALLEADAGHTFSDALAAMAVLASFGGIALGFELADIIAAAVVCVFIARTAWSIFRYNFSVLTDTARLDPREVHRIATSIPEVRGAHRVRSRGLRDFVHVDLHIQLDPSMTLAQAHELTHAVARAITQAFPNVRDVVIHTEPADGHQDEVPLAPEH